MGYKFYKAHWTKTVNKQIIEKGFECYFTSNDVENDLEFKKRVNELTIKKPIAKLDFIKRDKITQKEYEKFRGPFIQGRFALKDHG